MPNTVNKKNSNPTDEGVALLFASDLVQEISRYAKSHGDKYDVVQLVQLTANELFGFAKDMIEKPEDFDGII